MAGWLYLVLSLPFLAAYVGAIIGYHRTKNVLLLLIAIPLAIVGVLLLWFASANA
jgi:hypothetical protein